MSLLDRARPASPAADAAAPGRGRRRGWRSRVVLGATVVVAVALLVTWLVGWSPVLGAASVEVHGTTTLSAAQVRAAAAVPDGTPLVRLDTAAVARRVERVPDVASATVHVSYPTTVVVDVVERTPVLLLSDPVRLVDATGDAYRTVPAAPGGLPTTAAGGALVRPAAAAAAALPARTRALVARVDVDPAGAVTLHLADGRTVLWGDGSRAGEKAQLLTALVAPADGTAPTVGGQQIDLRAPDVVVAR